MTKVFKVGAETTTKQPSKNGTKNGVPPKLHTEVREYNGIPTFVIKANKDDEYDIMKFQMRKAKALVAVHVALLSYVAKYDK